MTNLYGAQETSPLPANYQFPTGDPVCWTTPGLRVTRLRLLSDPGFPWWDVSYCHGMLDGKPVNVALPFDQLPRRGARRAIVTYAKKADVFAQRLGILTNISTLV